MSKKLVIGIIGILVIIMICVLMFHHKKDTIENSDVLLEESTEGTTELEEIESQMVTYDPVTGKNVDSRTGKIID